MTGPVLVSPEDLRLVGKLRDGDEAAFRDLVDRYMPSMLRVARMYVSTTAVAEEVVQEAWVGILQGLDRFEGRSSLRTWMFRILVNIAKTRGQREGRSVPFSALAGDDSDEPSISAERFLSEGEPRPGHWSSVPPSWEGVPEERLLSGESVSRVGDAIRELPPMQAEVIRLRDVQGWTSAEVCNALGISETNQRVLLHRARAKVRRSLEPYIDDEVMAP